MTCREKILSEDYLDLLTYYTLYPGSRQEERDSEIFCDIPVSGSLWSIYYDRAFLPPLSFGTYNYRYITELYGLMDEFSPEAFEQRFDPQPLIRSGISTVQRNPLNLTGRGVAVGFADTGIDYRNPVFRRTDGSTRILAIWDQTDQSGTPPEGYEYGSEYTREQINRALSLENPLELVPTTDENGHGTNLASAAAGSALEGGLGFLGAAPEADIVVVKMKQAKQYFRDFYMLPEGVPAYEAGDVALAVKYLDSFAIPLQRPVVICLGIGRSSGSHLGVSALDQYLSSVSSDVNRCVVVAGGNEGNTAHHYEGSLQNGDVAETELRVEEGTAGFLLEVWGMLPGFFSLGLRSPAGESIPVVSGRLGQNLEYTFVYGGTRLNLDYQLNDQVTGSEVAVLRFENPTAGIWTIQVYREGEDGPGTFHMWLPIRQFVEGRVEFLQPSPEHTLTMPGYAQDVLTVSAYNSRDNSFYANSGQGFGLYGRIKPELAAPGVDISTAVGMLGGKTVVGTATGTSMAAALTAGACAQLFQWCVPEGNYPDISGVGIRNFLERGAAREQTYTYPNRQWGFGRLDMEQTFNRIAGIV